MAAAAALERVRSLRGLLCGDGVAGPVDSSSPLTVEFGMMDEAFAPSLTLRLAPSALVFGVAATASSSVPRLAPAGLSSLVCVPLFEEVLTGLPARFLFCDLDLSAGRPFARAASAALAIFVMVLGSPAVLEGIASAVFPASALLPPPLPPPPPLPLVSEVLLVPWACFLVLFAGAPSAAPLPPFVRRFLGLGSSLSTTTSCGAHRLITSTSLSSYLTL
mmetsp:Transcript_8745/g.26172  ORF Transcript_8745/g.26172 Transcript_8745/m.26172 type:complete len:219 (-) Transcript_8745:1872-2528(-)